MMGSAEAAGVDRARAAADAAAASPLLEDVNLAGRRAVYWSTSPPVAA